MTDEQETAVTQVSFRIPTSLKTDIEKFLEKTGRYMSTSDFFRDALRRLLELEEKK